MFGTRRVRVRSLNALLCQVLRKIVWSYHSMICIMAAFLLVSPIVMSSYESTIIQCKSNTLRWCAVLSKFCSKAKKIPTLPPCVENLLFVNKPGGQFLRGLRVATSPSFGQCFARFICALANSLVRRGAGFLSAGEISEAFKVTRSNLTCL